MLWTSSRRSGSANASATCRPLNFGVLSLFAGLLFRGTTMSRRQLPFRRGLVSRHKSIRSSVMLTPITLGRYFLIIFPLKLLFRFLVMKNMSWYYVSIIVLGFMV